MSTADAKASREKDEIALHGAMRGMCLFPRAEDEGEGQEWRGGQEQRDVLYDASHLQQAGNPVCRTRGWERKRPPGAKLSSALEKPCGGLWTTSGRGIRDIWGKFESCHQCPAARWQQPPMWSPASTSALPHTVNSPPAARMSF